MDGVDFTPSPSRRRAQAGRKPCNAIVYQGSAIWNKGDVDKVSQNETDQWLELRGRSLVTLI